MDNDLDVGKDIVLAPKYKGFVTEYLLDFDRKRAARRSGITLRTACKWLKMSEVQEYISYNQAKIAQECNITQEECLNELGKIAFFDHKDYISNMIVVPQDMKSDEGETNSIGIYIEDYDHIDLSAVKTVNIKEDKSGRAYLEIVPYNKVDALKELLAWFKNSRLPENVHFHITKEDLQGRTAQDITKDYHELVQSSPLPQTKS